MFCSPWIIEARSFSDGQYNSIMGLQRLLVYSFAHNHCIIIMRRYMKSTLESFATAQPLGKRLRRKLFLKHCFDKLRLVRMRFELSLEMKWVTNELICVLIYCRTCSLIYKSFNFYSFLVDNIHSVHSSVVTINSMHHPLSLTDTQHILQLRRLPFRLDLNLLQF